MTADGRLIYFAYGSNMLEARLRERLPRVAHIGAGRLRGWRLRFDKRGARDGSGKCHIERVGDARACVWGVLYRMRDDERRELDRIEGVGHGYAVAWTAIECATGGTTVDAFYYAADAAHVDPTLIPYDWYRALVLAGALAHDFPADYVEALRAVRCRIDDDAARAARAWRLIDADPVLAAKVARADTRTGGLAAPP